MDGMTEKINGGVCAAAGFKANGIHCGLYKDKDKNDLALIFSDVPAKAAAVYTTNKVKGAPLLVTKRHLKESDHTARAIIANSKNANTCNADGEQTAERMASLAAEALHVPSEQVLVASTGIIGQPLPTAPIADHIGELIEGLSKEAHESAARAIMTTDTVSKESAYAFRVGGRICRIGGMSKGSGMIHPNMATTLTFLTTDAAVSAPLLQQALSDAVQVTYNCLSVDGDTSTNDMVLLLANGRAENEEITSEGEDYAAFYEALRLTMTDLVRMLAKDGEGASKLLTCTTSGAADWPTAAAVAKSVIRSPLLKCAMFGEDANWGRILCAIGYADACFSIEKVSVDLASAAGRIGVCECGTGISFSEERAKEILKEDEIEILVDLHEGEASAQAWGCDLTYDYVRINGSYRS